VFGDLWGAKDGLLFKLGIDISTVIWYVFKIIVMIYYWPAFLGGYLMDSSQFAYFGRREEETSLLSKSMH
jgi:hypothetical protein